jgi:Protein of unknown function (DUF3043)
MPSLFKKPAPPVVDLDEESLRPNAKGRPTPTRKEAQAARRSSPARRGSSRSSSAKPGDPKAAKAAMREARREKAAEYRAAMNSGDIKRLPPRERVPERIMARNIVDQRRNFGPPLLAVLVVAYLLGLAPGKSLKVAAFYLLGLCLLGIIADCIYIGRRVTREVHERYPNSTVKLKGAVAQRALMPARWRQPRPSPDIVVGRWIPRG